MTDIHVQGELESGRPYGTSEDGARWARFSAFDDLVAGFCLCTECGSLIEEEGWATLKGCGKRRLCLDCVRID